MRFPHLYDVVGAAKSRIRYRTLSIDGEIDFFANSASIISLYVNMPYPFEQRMKYGTFV